MENESLQQSSEDFHRDEGLADAFLRKKIAEITPSNAELLKLAEVSRPPQRWYEENQDDLLGLNK